jgi:hypothetical protein
MIRWFQQSYISLCSWLFTMVGTLVVATLWATAQPLPESAILSADALIINAADGIDVETLAQARDLLTAQAVQYAYLAGSQANLVAHDFIHSGVGTERQRYLDSVTSLLASARADGCRRLIVVAPYGQQLALVRQAQTMGFRVMALTGDRSPEPGEWL